TLGITFIFVTHDQEEAMTMADRIAVMDKGKVLQIGTPEEIYETPTTKFVADFIGETNFLKGTLVEKKDKYGVVKLDESTSIRAIPSNPDMAIGQEVTVAIRPEKINLFPASGVMKYPDSSTDSVERYKEALVKDPDINLIQGVIHQDIYIGTDTRYIVGIGAKSNIEVAVRVQNFGLRSESYYEKDQAINV